MTCSEREFHSHRAVCEGQEAIAIDDARNGMWSRGYRSVHTVSTSDRPTGWHVYRVSTHMHMHMQYTTLKSIVSNMHWMYRVGQIK